MLRNVDTYYFKYLYYSCRIILLGTVKDSKNSRNFVLKFGLTDLYMIKLQTSLSDIIVKFKVY